MYLWKTWVSIYLPGLSSSLGVGALGSHRLLSRRNGNAGWEVAFDGEIQWDFMVVYGDLMGFYGILWCLNGIYGEIPSGKC